MADNNVVIRIDVRANTAEIDRVRRKLATLRLESEALSDEFGDAADAVDDLDDSMASLGGSTSGTGRDFRNLSRDTSRLENRFSKLDKVAQGFGRFLQGAMKVGMKLLLLNTVAVGVALVSVNAAFAVGRFAVQAWHATLTAAAAVGASFVAVLSSIAAGQREYNAALQAYNYRHSPGLTAGTQEAMAQLRGLSTNTRLAVLGAESLNGAFAALSRNTQVNGTLQAALTAMGDFAASSADPAKSFVAAGDFLGQLVKTGKIDENIQKLADEVGPKFAEAIASSIASGQTGATDVLQALIGGDLAKGVGVDGQLSAINNTLFGTVKRNFQLIKEQFADMGQAFLPEFTVAIEEISRIFSRFMISIGGSVQRFARGGMVDGLVGAIDKLATWTSHLFNEYLPRTEGMIETVKDWGSSVADGWKAMTNALRPLLDGARVLMDAFGPLFKAVFTEFGGGVRDFGQLLEDNSEIVMEFGDGALKLFHSISDLFGVMKEALVQVLPIATKILDIFTDMVSAVTDMMSAFNSKGALGSLAGIGVLLAGYIGLGQLGKSGTKKGKGLLGGLLGTSGAGGAYTINASTVYVNGGIVQSGVGSLGAAGAAGVGGAARTGWKGRLGTFGAGIAPLAGGVLAAGGAYGLANSNSTWQSAASGTALGAGIGTMIAPGVGTAIGAGVGFAGGMLYDTFVGEPGRNKDYAKQTATNYSSEQEKQIVEAISTGNTETARALLQWDQGRSHVMYAIMQGYDESGTYNNAVGSLGKEEYLKEFRDRGVLSDEEFKSLLKASDTFIDTLFDQEFALRQKYTPALQQFEDNLEGLGKATGLSDNAIMNLAESLGIDLTSKLESSQAFFEEALGVAIPQSIEDLAMGASDAFLNALEAATNPIIQRQERAEAVDQSTSLIHDAANAGTLTSTDVAKWVQDAATFEYINNPNDPNAALENLIRMVGPGGSMYGQNALLAGQENAILPLVQPILDQFAAGFDTEYRAMLNGVVAQQAFDQNGLPIDTSSQVAGYDPTQIGSLESAASQMLAAPAQMTEAMTSSIPSISSSMSAAVTSALSAASINVNVTGSITGATITQTTGGGGDDKPTPIGNGRSVDDTMTSRLSSLMNKHSALDGMITGKRKITSSFRNDGLGSLNSDHVTGHAYDLTGDNLGAYKTAVDKAGGFAELHGRGESRHLHVAQGDTATPWIGGSGIGRSGDSIVIQVQSTPNASPEQISAAVMREIDRRQRDRRERS